jgi:hypothetical protein
MFEKMGSTIIMAGVELGMTNFLKNGIDTCGVRRIVVYQAFESIAWHRDGRVTTSGTSTTISLPRSGASTMILPGNKRVSLKAFPEPAYSTMLTLQHFPGLTVMESANFWPKTYDFDA